MKTASRFPQQSRKRSAPAKAGGGESYASMNAGPAPLRLIRWQQSSRLTQRFFQITYGLRPIVNGSLPDRFEAHGYVEGLRHEVWRIDIHLANNPIMPSFPRLGKEVVIQKPGNPPASRRTQDNNAINVDKGLTG